MLRRHRQSWIDHKRRPLAPSSDYHDDDDQNDHEQQQQQQQWSAHEARVSASTGHHPPAARRYPRRTLGAHRIIIAAKATAWRQPPGQHRSSPGRSTTFKGDVADRTPRLWTAPWWALGRRLPSIPPLVAARWRPNSLGCTVTGRWHFSRGRTGWRRRPVMAPLHGLWISEDRRRISNGVDVVSGGDARWSLCTNCHGIARHAA